MMKKWLVLGMGMLLMIPSLSWAGRLQVTVPAGIKQVSLLSPGTGPVLDHLRGKLDADLKAFDAQYHVAELKQAADAAKALSAERREAYQKGGKSVGEEYIGKIHIAITKVEANISSESSLGEISFAYTATNNSDRIVSDVVYTPRIGKMKIPVASKLVLEFIDPVTLKFGLGPGRSLSSKADSPETLSFLMGEVSKQDLGYIKQNVTTAFGLDIEDIHFMSSIGYKDQSKVMDVEQAFQGRLKELELASSAAQREAEAKAAAYTQAKAAYDKAKEGTVKQFRTAAQSLKQSAVRITQPVDKKGRGVFSDIAPGAYYLYAEDGRGKVVFQAVQVQRAREKVKVETLVKDPFLP